jgi:hypothetical protein
LQVIYRVRQFWHALTEVPAQEDLLQARQVLSPALMALFLRLQPGEQAHSLWIYCQLLQQDQEDQDLLVAALLHDVGKIRHPLRLWERVVIVLGKTWFPERIKAWGRAAPYGWRRSFVVAEQHPAWGAELAAQAGASPMAATLIRRHQDVLDPDAMTSLGERASLEDRLLSRLQSLDNES